MAKQTLTVQLMHANQRIASLETQLAASEAKFAEIERQAELMTQYMGQSAQRNEQRTTKSLLDFEASRKGYYAYVGAKRTWCRVANKPVSYKTFDQFMSAHRAQQGTH